MEKFQSLADFLGVQDPVTKEAPSEPSRPNARLTAKAFCKQILESKDYRDSLVRRIVMDELPPAVEVLLYHYAHGKPVERVEVKDTTDPLEDFTPEQLEERAARLLEIAQALAKDEDHVEPGAKPRQVH